MLVYLNGVFLPSDQALVPVTDRGFRFGDGVFETVPVYHGHPYQWPFHLARLTEGLSTLSIPLTTEMLEPAVRELIRRNNLREGYARISVSRGHGSLGYLPQVGGLPTLVIETLPPRELAWEAVRLWQSAYEKPSPRSLPTHCKTAQGLNSTLARMEAVHHSCFDSLLCDAQGNVAETSSANLFWLMGDTLYTPALSTGALSGATRHAVIRLSPWPVEEVEAPLDTLRSADAVIITSCSLPVLPVSHLAPLGWIWNSIAPARILYDRVKQDIMANCVR